MIPPRKILTGDTREAVKLLRFAGEQLRILDAWRGHQNLFQATRKFQLHDGIQVVVRCIGALNDIDIFVPPGVTVSLPVTREQIRVEECWCNCCFTPGIVLEVIGRYGDFDSARDGATFETFSGIRYRVQVCQQTRLSEVLALSSDYAEYIEGDNVAVLYLGRSDGSFSSCLACAAQCGRAACHGLVDGGRWIILPLTLTLPVEEDNLLAL